MRECALGRLAQTLDPAESVDLLPHMAEGGLMPIIGHAASLPSGAADR